LLGGALDLLGGPVRLRDRVPLATCEQRCAWRHVLPLPLVKVALVVAQVVFAEHHAREAVEVNPLLDVRGHRNAVAPVHRVAAHVRALLLPDEGFAALGDRVPLRRPEARALGPLPASSSHQVRHEVDSLVDHVVPVDAELIQDLVAQRASTELQLSGHERIYQATGEPLPATSWDRSARRPGERALDGAEKLDGRLATERSVDWHHIAPIALRCSTSDSESPGMPLSRSPSSKSVGTVGTSS